MAKKLPHVVKENAVLRGLLDDLVHAAERVADKYGEEGWREWESLKLAIREARSKGKLGRRTDGEA